MATTLDRSLDEIISSTKPAARTRDTRAPKKVANKVTKAAPAKGRKAGNATPAKKAVAQNQNGRAQKGRAPAVLPVTATANKVVVHGLPKDINSDAIKEFFGSQIGGVTTVSLAYNAKGQSSGIATIIFRRAELAAKAFAKYNGAPIDGGSTKLRLEMVIDPNRNSLISRIQPNQVAKAVVAAKKQQNGRTATNGKAKKAQPPTPAKKAAPAKKAKAPKRGKKTIEELDQEMADYFETK